MLPDGGPACSRKFPIFWGTVVETVMQAMALTVAATSGSMQRKFMRTTMPYALWFLQSFPSFGTAPQTHMQTEALTLATTVSMHHMSMSPVHFTYSTRQSLTSYFHYSFEVQHMIDAQCSGKLNCSLWQRYLPQSQVPAAWHERSRLSFVRHKIIVPSNLFAACGSCKTPCFYSRASQCQCLLLATLLVYVVLLISVRCVALARALPTCHSSATTSTYVPTYVLGPYPHETPNYTYA